LERLLDRRGQSAAPGIHRSRPRRPGPGVYLGLGYHELRVNAASRPAVLDPGWTTFDKRVLYVTYDISSLLQEGGNAIGVLLGQGWFKSRALLAQINIELAGGGTISVVSDATWAAADGPIVMGQRL